MSSGDNNIVVKALGQTGYYFELGDINILIDPYLSDYVQKKEGDELKRLIPVPVKPEEFNKVDWLLITHDHIDHCDPETIVPLINKFPDLKILGPHPVCRALEKFGVNKAQFFLASTEWYSLSDNLRVKAVPAAHPVIRKHEDGTYDCVGYLIEYSGKKIYHSGDTSVNEELINVLKKEDCIDVGFISVNERNYYRDKAGIIGNMSVREAFQFARDINVLSFIPMHWDMFEVNAVYKEEIELLYNKIQPGFDLEINPTLI